MAGTAGIEKMTLPANLHHGYIGAMLMMTGLYLEVQTWDNQGNFRNLFPFQDVFSWVIAFAGFGLFLSDLVEHFIQKEKHGEDLK